MPDVDISAYHLRAGNTPAPVRLPRASLRERARQTAYRLAGPRSAGPVTFWADVAEFQPVYDASYPWPVAAFRADNGGRLDYHAEANWAYLSGALRTGAIRAVLAYVVFKPDRLTGVMGRIRELFGTTPPRGLVIEIDMESGYQFAGPGNHSLEANTWAAAFAAYTRSWAREVPYANGYDYAANWPQLDARLTHRVTASYGSADPGGWAQQFYGGQSYPVPLGFPRSVAPFGAWVDLNAARRSLSQVLTDLGITGAGPTPAPHREITMFMAQNEANGGIGLVLDDGHMKPITSVAAVGNYHQLGIPGPLPFAGVEFSGYPRLGGMALNATGAAGVAPDFPDLRGPELDAMFASWDEE